MIRGELRSPLPPREGRWPGALQITAPRLALATFATAAEVQSSGEIHYLDMAGGDLADLNSGGPLLLEHRASIDNLLGSVEEAWIDGDQAQAIVRFADLPTANTIWALLEQGFPIGCSMGYHVHSVRPADGREGCYHVDAWSAYEISAAIITKAGNPFASITRRSYAELVALQQQQRDKRLFAGRRYHLERVDGLKLVLRPDAPGLPSVEVVLHPDQALALADQLKANALLALRPGNGADRSALHHGDRDA